MTYCYINLNNGEKFTSTKYGLEHIGNVRRDYRAENAGFVVPSYMKSSNTSGKNDFLPTAKDYESPSDPDGGNGIREWNENHEGAFGNKSPRRPSLPAGAKRVLPLSDGGHK